jgi:DNA invertase Pin-like site-specific DNA recombinase
MLAGLKSGDVVIAAKLDRAFRSAGDALKTLEDFKRRGVDLHLIDLGGSVIKNGNAKFLFTRPDHPIYYSRGTQRKGH